MAAANKDILINILTKAAGTSSVKELNSVLSSLNQNTVSIGKNNQFYQKGVAGSISGTKALTATASGLNKIIQQQAASMRAANAVRAAEVKAIELTVRAKKAEIAQDDLALKQLRQEIQLRELAVRERRAAIAETTLLAKESGAAAAASSSSAAAAQQQSTSFVAMGHAAGAATFALTSMGQMFADAGQFGMGFAQGLRAITNNVQQAFGGFVMLRMMVGSTTAAFAALRSVAFGPLGILFAFQAFTGILEGVTNWMQRSKKKTEEAKSAFEDLFKAMQNGKSVSLTTVEQVNSLIDAYGRLSPKTLGRNKKDIEGNVESLRELRDEIILNEALYREQLEALGRNGILLADIIAKNRELGEEFANLREPMSLLRRDEWERNSILTEQIDILKERDKLQRQLFLNSMQTVGEAGESFRELRKELDLMRDAAAAGFSDPQAFATEYEIFSGRLKKIGQEISRSEFAKLFRDGEEEEFFSDKYKKFILERVDGTINAMERLNRAANRFGAGAAPRGLQSNIVSRLDEIRRSATLVGRLDGVEGIGSDELRVMSDATLSEMDRLGAEIEARNRAGTDSWRAHWISRTEASVKAASIVSSSVGDIGTVFMQLAQTGDRSNKRMFETGKKFAIAQALISTYVGFTKALEQRGPLGLVAGAAVLASGMAKVAAIRATTMNGSGGSGSSGASGVSSAPTFFTGFGNVSDFPGSSPSFPIVPLNQQTVNINLSASGRDLVGVIESEASASQRRIGGGAIGSSMFSASRSGGILSTGNRDNLVI